MEQIEYWKSTQLESYPNEEWKSLDFMGYPNYAVSNLGRVKSLNYNKTGKHRIMKQCLNGWGYPHVQLWGDRKGWYTRVHRLVAKAFVLNPKNNSQIDHINTVRTDNRAENLQWVTCKENCNNPLTLKHKSDGQIGEKGSNWGKFGRLHANHKPIVQLTLTGEFVRQWDCAKDVYRELGISYKTISSVLHGKGHSAGGYFWKWA